MASEKTLKTIVIVLGVLLIGGFAVLVGIIIKRALDLGEDEGETTGGPVLTVPGDATPLGMSQKQAVVILEVRTAGGEIEELVFDAQTGDYLGRLVREE